jgi:Na+-driven multidrug efflux pump
MSVAAIVIFIFARPIASLFVGDAEVINDAVSFIRVLALASR